MKTRIAILLSGEGTTAEAVIRACAAGTVNYEVGIIICSRKDAGIFQRINKLNSELNLAIPCILINHHTHPAGEGEPWQKGQQTIAEQTAIVNTIIACGCTLVVLLGYMKRTGATMIDAFGWHDDYTSPYQAMMLNTHTGLLPETKGAYGVFIQKRVLELRMQEAGQTLHVVSAEYDEGPTIAEHRIPVSPNDTPEGLFERVRIEEKAHIAQDIERFLRGRDELLTKQES
jgi:phosphoribosylglycinamide formyltransferase-1